jgi:hypothetical protein
MLLIVPVALTKTDDNMYCLIPAEAKSAAGIDCNVVAPTILEVPTRKRIGAEADWVIGVKTSIISASTTDPTGSDLTAKASAVLSAPFFAKEYEKRNVDIEAALTVISPRGMLVFDGTSPNLCKAG